MSTDISQISGYDATMYEELASEYTQKTGKSEADLQEILLDLVNRNNSFEDAIGLVRADLPELSPPIWERDFTSYTAGALPSFGSNYMALITEIASDQRKQAHDMKALQTEALISNIEEQAKNIRTKAALDLTAGIISGTAQIASGVFSAVAIGAGMNKLSGVSENMFTGKAMALNTQVQGISSAITGGGSIGSAGFNFGGQMVDASTKKLEADAERIRATQDQLDRQSNALHEVIQKALSSQDAIQQNMNQTRTKILG